MTDTAAGTNRLRRNSLGLYAVIFLVISAAAPLTGVAGAIPIAFLTGNGAGVPATILALTGLMLVFAVGYVAMARHVDSAGAFYAFTARGLGSSAGGAVAFIALLSYNALVFGLLGLLGGAAAGLFGSLGVNLPWWAYSLMAIAMSAFLGYRRVELSSRVLMVLVLLEYLIVLIFDAVILAKGGVAGLGFPMFDPDTLRSGAPAAAILLCFGSFIGLEATTIYAEEAHEPQRTIPRATYLSILLIGLFYVLTTWMMVAATGADELVPTVAGLADPTTFFFDLVGQHVGGPVALLAGILFVSSLFAAVSAFHNYIARYIYVAGRDRLLPRAFARTHPVHQSPYMGSLLQTLLSLAVVGLFAWAGLDPIAHLFTWLAQLGVMGVLSMMAVVSFAVIAFFRRRPAGDVSILASLILPLIAGVAIGLLFAFAFATFGDVTGTRGGALGIVLPALIPVAAGLGYLAASALRSRDPAAWAKMGHYTE